MERNSELLSLKKERSSLLEELKINNEKIEQLQLKYNELQQSAKDNAIKAHSEYIFRESK